MSRKGFTASAAASPHAIEEPDMGSALSPEAAHLAHLNRAPAGAHGADMDADMMPTSTGGVIEED